MRHQIAFNALSQQIDDPNTYLHDLRVSCEAFDQANEWLERAEAGDAAVAAEIPEEHWESIRDNAQISQEAVVVHVNSGQVQAVIDWLKKYIPILLRKIKEIFMNFFAWIRRKFQQMGRGLTSLQDAVRNSLSSNYTVKLHEPLTERDKFLATVFSSMSFYLNVKVPTFSKTTILNPKDTIAELFEVAEGWLVIDRNISPFKRNDIPPITTAQEGIDFLNTELKSPRMVMLDSEAYLASKYRGPSEINFYKKTFERTLKDMSKTEENLTYSADLSVRSIEHDRRFIESLQPVFESNAVDYKLKLKALNYKLNAVTEGLSWRLRTLDSLLRLARRAAAA
mgnify:CR=1 FL=1